MAALFTCQSADAKTLKFAKTYTLALEVAPPFSSFSIDNKPQGLAIEMLTKLVNKSGNKLNPVVCPFARCLKLVEQGQADFIFGVLKTPKRSQYLEYIQPAFSTFPTEIGFYQLKNSSKKIESFDNILNLTVGVQRGALHYEAFDNNKKINKVSVVSIANLIEMLTKGRIDTFAMLRQSAEQYLKKHDNSGLIKLSDYVVNQHQKGYIAMSKRSRYIKDLPTLNQQFKQIKESCELSDMLNKYNLQ